MIPDHYIIIRNKSLYFPALNHKGNTDLFKPV